MFSTSGFSKTLRGTVSQRPKLALAAAVLVALLAPFPGHADETDPLDPSNYARLTWNGHDIVRPPEGKVYEVIGNSGEVKIDFDRERMKDLWDFDTRGSLSLRGWVVPAGGDRRNIEIEGYSMVGETLKVFDLDLSAAFEIVSQLLQGDRLANRLRRANREAKLAGLRAKKAALVERLSIEGRVVAETERALRAVYTEALRFTLDGRHIQDAAASIAAAETARAGAASPAAAAKAAALDSFFRDLEVQRVTLKAWLGSVLSDANRPYMPILAQIAGRSEHIVRAVAEEVQALLQRLEEGGSTKRPEAPHRPMMARPTKPGTRA